jgi:hypothetical protein
MPVCSLLGVDKAHLDAKLAELQPGSQHRGELASGEDHVVARAPFDPAGADVQPVRGVGSEDEVVLANAKQTGELPAGHIARRLRLGPSEGPVLCLERRPLDRAAGSARERALGCGVEVGVLGDHGELTRALCLAERHDRL